MPTYSFHNTAVILAMTLRYGSSTRLSKPMAYRAYFGGGGGNCFLKMGFSGGGFFFWYFPQKT